MVWLKHINDEEGADYGKTDVQGLLSDGYNFSDERVSVLVRGDDGSEVAHSLDPDTAKKYITGGQGSYMDAADVEEYKRGGGGNWSGIGGGAAAVGLGFADALTFGAATPFAGQLGLDTESIEREWGGTKLATDLATTGLAIGLSGGLAAPAAGGKAAQILARLGQKKLVKAVGKAPWKYTAPAVSDKVGRLVTKKIADSLLKGAGEETVKQAAARGLLARVGGFSVEGLMYGAGYGTVDAAIGMYNGRDPEDVAKTFLTELGYGALLGAIIPTVFHGASTVAMKGLKHGVGLGKKALNLAADSKVAESYNRHIMAAAENANPNEYLRASQGMDLAEARQKAHLVDESHKSIRELAKRQDEVIDHVAGQHLNEVKGIQSAFDEFDQAGHENKFILDAFDESFDVKNVYDKDGLLTREATGMPAKDGAASTIILADTLLEGMDKYGRNVGTPLMGTGPEAARRSSEGLLDILENLTERFRVQGTVVKADVRKPSLKPGLETSKEIRPQGDKELKNIAATIRALREKVRKKVDDIADDIIDNNPNLLYPGMGLRKERKWKWEGGQKVYHYFSDLGRQLSQLGTGGKTTRTRLLTMWGDPNAKQILDRKFNQEIFSELEFLASRLHRGIKEGPFPDLEPYQEFMNLFKQEITPFLSNADQWNITPSAETVSTSFGKMSEYKNEINTLMTKREGDHQAVRKHWLEEDPDALPGNFRPSLEKIEKFIHTLDHRNSQNKLEWLESYSSTTRELMELLHTRYRVPKPVSAPGTAGRKAYWKLIEGREKWLEEAVKAEEGIAGFGRFLREDMTPALQYAALIQREAAIARAVDSPGLYLPKVMGLGIGGALGAMGGFPLMGAVAGLGAGAFKGANDAMVNPGGSLAKMHLFFSTVNTMEDFVQEQVERYFKWINYHKDFEGVPGMWSKTELKAMREEASKEAIKTGRKHVERLVYDGPGTGLKRFPRVYTSNAIARLVTGDNAAFKEEDDDLEETIGSEFTPKHAKRAKAISEALSKPEVKEALLEKSVEAFGFDPNLQQALKEQTSAALDASKKEVDKLKFPEPGVFDDPTVQHTVPDSVAQTAGENLSVIEYGIGVVMKGLFDGTLTSNEADTAWKVHPQQMTKLAALFYEKLADPKTRAGIPKKEIELMKLILRNDSADNAVAFALQENYRKEEEEKPGPTAQPKWIEGRFPGTQLAGSYAVEQRRIT